MLIDSWEAISFWWYWLFLKPSNFRAKNCAPRPLYQWTMVGRQLQAFRMVAPATSCRCFRRGTKIWMPPSILQVAIHIDMNQYLSKSIRHHINMTYDDDVVVWFLKKGYQGCCKFLAHRTKDTKDPPESPKSLRSSLLSWEALTASACTSQELWFKRWFGKEVPRLCYFRGLPKSAKL